MCTQTRLAAPALRAIRDHALQHQRARDTALILCGEMRISRVVSRHGGRPRSHPRLVSRQQPRGIADIERRIEHVRRRREGVPVPAPIDLHAPDIDIVDPGREQCPKVLCRRLSRPKMKAPVPVRVERPGPGMAHATTAGQTALHRRQSAQKPERNAGLSRSGNERDLAMRHLPRRTLGVDRGRLTMMGCKRQNGTRRGT